MDEKTKAELKRLDDENRINTARIVGLTNAVATLTAYLSREAENPDEFIAKASEAITANMRAFDTGHFDDWTLTEAVKDHAKHFRETATLALRGVSVAPGDTDDTDS